MFGLSTVSYGRGKLPGFKVGTYWRFTSETLEEFMKSGMPIDDPK